MGADRSTARSSSPVATTEEKLLKPASIYAINKRDHEEMFVAVGMALQIPTVALRLFNAYGSRQALSNPYTGVAAIFISRLLNDQPPLVFEDGNQQRDFVHVQDVANAFLTVLESDEAVWDVFNVGSGTPITVDRYRHDAGADAGQGHRRRNCLGEVPRRRHPPLLSGHLENRTDLGFRPARSFDEGMQELSSWVGRQANEKQKLPA